MSIETPVQATRLDNIQSLRGLAALLVVVSHLFIIEQKYSPDQIFGKWAELGMIGVDLFFAISGFIMVHIAWTSRRGIPAATEFLFARITRIYPLYWLISFAVLAVYLWRPDMIFSGYSTEPNILKSFALFPDVRDPLLAVGWTLIHEMGFYLVFVIALFLKPRWTFPFLLIWTLIIGIGQKFALEVHSPVAKVLFSPLTYEFLAGAFAGLAFHRFEGKFGRLTLLLSILLWGGTLAMLITTENFMIDSHLGRAIHFALPSALLVYGLASLKTFPKFTQTLGDWSYALYLTHILSLSLLGRIWHILAQDGIVDNWLALPVLTLGSICVAGLVYKLAEQPMLRIARHARTKLFG